MLLCCELCLFVWLFFFFFKQKTAYEMRISDWSSDVCSSDLFDKVMEGLAAAKDAGLQVKINAVALKGVHDDEVDRLVAWCGGEGYDLTFIEVMPMGEIGEQRVDQYWPRSSLRAQLADNWALEDTDS